MRGDFSLSLSVSLSHLFGRSPLNRDDNGKIRRAPLCERVIYVLIRRPGGTAAAPEVSIAPPKQRNTTTTTIIMCTESMLPLSRARLRASRKTLSRPKRFAVVTRDAQVRNLRTTDKIYLRSSAGPRNSHNSSDVFDTFCPLALIYE